jgi:hypothetical protein
MVGGFTRNPQILRGQPLKRLVTCINQYLFRQTSESLWFPKIRSGRVGAVGPNQGIIHSMLAIVHLLGTHLANLFKSRRRLEAENLFLRHQLNIAVGPPRFRSGSTLAARPSIGCWRTARAVYGKHWRTLDQLDRPRRLGHPSRYFANRVL